MAPPVLRHRHFYHYLLSLSILITHRTHFSARLKQNIVTHNEAKVERVLHDILQDAAQDPPHNRGSCLHIHFQANKRHQAYSAETTTRHQRMYLEHLASSNHNMHHALLGNSSAPPLPFRFFLSACHGLVAAARQRRTQC